jgi:tRNA dimethylallyltransferase
MIDARRELTTSEICAHTDVAQASSPGSSGSVSLPDPSPLLILAGPTAVGKSGVALHLAELLGGEIVSVDSMQVYRGLDIGTSKPSAQDQARIPHHLINVVEVDQTFDAAQFVSMAGKAIGEIRSRARIPILCGGTGLYFNALLCGLGKGPPSDQALRAELARTPLADLVQELASSDPAILSRIDLKNPRRVIRAVEVSRLTGRPYSQQRAQWQFSANKSEPVPVMFGLSRAPADLRHRINERVDEMFRLGLVAETQRLLQQGLAQNPTAMQALGYRQVVEYLAGSRPLPETVQVVKARTRQYSKRQMTWFRRQLSLNWIQLELETKAIDVAQQIAAQCRAYPKS